MPWEQSPENPSFGLQDHSSDIRGGIGLEGLVNLKKFVEDGGLFIAVRASATLPVRLGLAPGVSIAETPKLKALGGIYRVEIEDPESPISYGYEDNLAVFFDSAPVFHIAVGSEEFQADQPSHGDRFSGRGSPTDPDIPQGRRWIKPEPEKQLSRREAEMHTDPKIAALEERFVPGSIIPASLLPRVILRFSQRDHLLVSGLLDGAEELAEAPAVIDAPVGRGHILLFAIDPTWRVETQGSIMLVLNAALHFDHLNVGRTSSAPLR